MNSSNNQLFDQFSKKVGDNNSLTIFQTTELLPTYVFGFSAGALVQIMPNVPVSSVPLTIYTIGSINLLVNDRAEFIFDVTAKAISFF